MLDRMIMRFHKNLFHNIAFFLDSVVTRLLYWLPDELYLKSRFRLGVGYWPNFENPKSFTEKINWLKLHDRKSAYTMMVDKYAVKGYVAQKVGAEFVIPTIAVWDSPEEIDFDRLPEQFVLKTTHGGGSGGVVVCRDKSLLNKEKAVSILRESMDSDIYKNFREWPYKNVRKRIIAETFIAPKAELQNAQYDLTDYKFFCFDGTPEYCQVIRDRHSKETIDFYDMRWRHQDFVGLLPRNGNCPVVSNGEVPVARPERLDDMISICKKLASGIPFVRVDLYVVEERVYFGELTFYPASGIGVFQPQNWDIELGKLINCKNETVLL